MALGCTVVSTVTRAYVDKGYRGHDTANRAACSSLARDVIHGQLIR
jgi:hypothetical protein